MNPEILNEYVDRIYGYAVRKTFSEEEAAELAQEILLCAVTNLPKLREDEKFEPWLWGVASNCAKAFRRHMGRQRAMYAYDIPETLLYEPELDEDREELYEYLRGRIAMLGKMYRDIIVLHYYDGLSTKQVAERLGIPAFYVEDRIAYLAKRCAVKEVSKGKWQTDFIILSDKHGKFCEEHKREAIASLLPQLTSAMQKLFSLVETMDHYRAKKSSEELKYLYGVMAFDYLQGRYGTMEYPQIEVNYDGNRWRYVSYMRNMQYPLLGFGTQSSRNLGSDGTYSHVVWTLKGHRYRKMMYDNYINACEELLRDGHSADEVSVAAAIGEGYIVRTEDGTFSVTVPAFTKEQKWQFDLMVNEVFAPYMEEYNEAVRGFAENYKKLFPKHLCVDAQRYCSGIFGAFFEVVTEACCNAGIMVQPQADWICDVLVQWK